MQDTLKAPSNVNAHTIPFDGESERGRVQFVSYFRANTLATNSPVVVL